MTSTPTAARAAPRVICSSRKSGPSIKFSAKASRPTPIPTTSNGGNQNGGAGQGSPSEKLTDLEKDIMTATWNLKRREASPTPSAKYKEDAGVVHDSQGQALQQAQSLAEK